MAFCVLLAGIAVDASFFAHFASAYSYTTPISWRDLRDVLFAFRIENLGDVDFETVLLASAALTLLTVVYKPAPWWIRVAVAVPQVPVLIVFPFGIAGLLFDLPFPKDGEWFHEGWPFMEAAALWVPVPVFSAGAAVFHRLRTIRAPHAP